MLSLFFFAYALARAMSDEGYIGPAYFVHAGQYETLKLMERRISCVITSLDFALIL